MDQTDIFKKIEELVQKVSLLEKSIKETSNPSIIVNMDVKNLNLQELNLEELAFHLDQLDIKELSGMLNLGNIFSPKVHPESKLKKTVLNKNTKLQDEEKNNKNDIRIKINGKLIPFSIE